jgi:hypothetical protein
MSLLKASFCKQKEDKMTTYTDGLNLLYPINFNALNKLTESIQDLDAILLFSKIKFHETHSKLTLKNGIKCITRTRKVMAKWFDFGLGKLDRLLRLLEKKGLIEIQKGLWYGKKQLFIATAQEEDYAAINTKVFTFLTEETGCLKAAVLFARIAFAMRNTKITHKGQKWCCLTREDLATLLSTSLRTTDAIIQKLVTKKLILAQNLVFKKKRRLHFSIPEETLNTLSQKAMAIMNEIKPEKEGRVVAPKEAKPTAEATLSHSCRFPHEEPAKNEVPIRLSTNSIKENNNTIPSPDEPKKPSVKHHDFSDINLNTINDKLNERQLLFLLSALKKTIQREQLMITNEKELFEELQYSILNPEQRRGVSSFKHAVSRCMQLLRQRMWRTPFGFHRYTESGQKIKTYREDQLKMHEERKRLECVSGKEITSKIAEYTEQGIRWAKQLSLYLAQAKNSKHNSDDLNLKIQFAFDKIKELISFGANLDSIQPYVVDN